MSNTLTLDLGTKTGWAISKTESGMVNFSPKKDSRGQRWIKYESFLNQLIDQHDIKLIYYERVVSHKRKEKKKLGNNKTVDKYVEGSIAAHVYGGFLALLEKVCYERNVEYIGVPVTTLKKFATGKGNAKKEEMIKAACKYTGRKITDDNEADALCLFKYAEEQ